VLVAGLPGAVVLVVERLRRRRVTSPSGQRPVPIDPIVGSPPY